MDTLNKLRSELRQRDLIVVSDGNDLVDYYVRLVDLCGSIKDLDSRNMQIRMK